MLGEGLSPCFVRIAEGLLMQVKAFGQLALAVDTDEGRLNEELVNRYAFTRSYFLLLQEVAGLQFSARELPIVYNTADWPADGPPGGYVTPQDGVTPSKVVSTFLAAWSYQWHCKRKLTSSVDRPLKAALWVYDKQGLVPAVEFVLDLQKHGFVLDPDVVFHTLDHLFSAYRTSESEGELAALFFGGAKPGGATAWAASELRPFKSYSIKREIPEAALSALLNAGLEEIEKVRAATSYDEWVLRQCTLQDHLSAILHVIQKYVSGPTLSLKSVLDHFEEIMADAGAVSGVLKTTANNPLTLPVSVMRVIREMMKAKLPTDWRDRLMQERAVIPYELEDYFCSGETVALPPRWQLLSPVLTPVFVQVISGNERLLLARVERFTADEVGRAPAARRILARWGFEDARTQDILISEYELRGALSPSLRLLSRKLAQGPGGSAQAPPADYRGAYIYDDATREWLESNKEEFKRLFEEIDFELCSEEVMASIKQANQAKSYYGPEAAVSYLEKLLARYPWFDFCYVELGIAYDESGKPESALPLLESAIALRPAEPTRWQSLSVVLNRLGDRRGAVLAKAISEMIQG